MACSVGNFGSVQPETDKARAPTILERIRSLDLLPRSPHATETDSPNAASQSKPQIYNGDDDPPVVQVEAGATPKGDNGYDLNFENAPVATIAKVILGDILQVGYTIDPRVQSTVSLSSGRPVPKSDILFVLENALRLSNIALLHDQSGYRLAPAPEAIGAGRTETMSAQAGYGTTVIPLRYVSVQTIVKLLDSFAVKPGAIRADTSRNLVLVQGTGAERRTALETVASFDADWMRGQSVAIYPVHNSAPDPLITELEKIMDAGDGGLNQNLVKFQAIARMNAVLVVSRKSELIKTAVTWIKRLDKSVTAGTNLKVYRLRYGDARQVASLLNEIFTGRTSGTSLESATNQIAPGAGTSTISSRGGATSAGGMLGGGSPGGGLGGGLLGGGGILGGGSTGGTLSALGIPAPGSSSGGSDQSGSSTHRPGITNPSGNAQSAPGAGGTGGAGGQGTEQGIMPSVRITADVVNNSVLVYADQEGHRIIEQTLRQIDRPQRQVAVDMTIAEVTLNNQLNYGVQFFLESHDVGLAHDKGSIINTIGNGVLSQVFPGFNFLAGSSADPRLILDALHQVTDVKVLSNPSIVVLDNQPASLQIGDSVPISTGTATVLTSNNTVVNTIQYLDTGIILKVTPRITSGGNVVLDIAQETSNVASTATADTLNPTVSQRRVQSTIAVANGQTVLLAGLISENVNRTRQGIPVLDQIPGLGDAFSHQLNSHQRTELIIFIRPQIIRDSVDASVVAEELRSKLNGRFIGSNLKTWEKRKDTEVLR